MQNNINVNVGGFQKAQYTYKTVVLKGSIPFDVQIGDPNTKYVIKYNFDLEDKTITIPEGCLLEFDGGSISNGTLVGQDIFLVYNQQLSDVISDIDLEGIFIHKHNISADDEDMEEVNNVIKLKDREPTSETNPDGGMGRIILRRNKLFAEQLTQENTIYEIRYDFDLEDTAVIIPANCVLEFDGGSLSNGTLIGNELLFTGNYEKKINVILSGTNKTKNFIVTNYYPTINKSQIETAHNGIILSGAVVVNDNIYLSTSICGKDNSVDGLQFGTEPNTYTVIIDSSYISIKNIFIYKPMPTEDVSDVLYSRIVRCNAKSNISINSCILNCGIRLDTGSSTATEYNYIENIDISYNTFNTDFTHINGNGLNDDVVMIIGARNSKINHNKVNAHNVERVFKVTSDDYGNYTENFEIKYNSVIAKCDDEIVQEQGDSFGTYGTGKQVIDIFKNPLSIFIEHNYFEIKNHTDLIENKSTGNPNNSIVSFRYNDVKINGITIWVSDKRCTLNIQQNNFTFYGTPLLIMPFSTVGIFCIMGIDIVNMEGNTIIESFTSVYPKIISVWFNYSSTASWNSFNNAYVFNLKKNNIILNNSDLLKAQTFPENETIGKAKAVFNICENWIDLNLNSQHRGAELYLIKNINFIGNSIRNRYTENSFKLNAYFLITGFLTDTLIGFRGNILYDINNLIMFDSTIYLDKGKHLANPSTGSGLYANDNEVTIYDGRAFYRSSEAFAVCYNGSAFVDTNGFTPGPHKGTTAQRPLGTGAEGGILVKPRDIGYYYFDTDLNMPIWASAINNDGRIIWRDALGNTMGAVYPMVIGTPTTGNLAKFNGNNIEDAGVAPQV